MSHRYYSPLRPLSLGTFPKPQGNEILHIENFEERQNVPEIARQAWGYIEYKLGGNYACVEYGEYEDVKKREAAQRQTKSAT